MRRRVDRHMRRPALCCRSRRARGLSRPARWPILRHKDRLRNCRSNCVVGGEISQSGLLSSDEPYRQLVRYVFIVRRYAFSRYVIGFAVTVTSPVAEDALGALRRVPFGFELVSGSGHRDTCELHVEPCRPLLGRPNSAGGLEYADLESPSFPLELWQCWPRWH